MESYCSWTEDLLSSPQLDRGQVEIIAYFIFLGSKITVVGDYSHGIKRCLLLGRKDMTNLDSVLRSRDITLLTKVHIVKASPDMKSRRIGKDCGDRKSIV